MLLFLTYDFSQNITYSSYRRDLVMPDAHVITVSVLLSSAGCLWFHGDVVMATSDCQMSPVCLCVFTLTLQSQNIVKPYFSLYIK